MSINDANKRRGFPQQDAETSIGRREERSPEGDPGFKALKACFTPLPALFPNLGLFLMFLVHHFLQHLLRLLIPYDFKQHGC